MFKSVAVAVLASQILWIGPLGLQSRNEFQSKLTAHVDKYDLAAANFVEALASVATKFQIPTVIEWVDTPVAKAPVRLSWRDATVLEIFDGIAKSEPGYEVRVKNGVVHVSPNNLTPSQNFLLLKIRTFEVHQVPAEVASRNLYGLVKSTVSPLKGPGGIGGSLGVNVGEPEISLKLDDASVEDIIDSLAAISSRNIWVVTFSDSFILTSTGFLRTETLWNKTPIPDDQQPVWDMFHWGDTIPSGAQGK